MNVLGRGEAKVLDDYCLAFAVTKVKLDEGKNYYRYCSFWCIVWMGWGFVWESLEEVVMMGVMKKEEWWPRIRIGLGHGVQRGNLDYPVKGLIHNGAVRSFCARRACARFVRVRAIIHTALAH